MALENYRITEFQEKTQVDNGDYVLIDSATDGTHKYQLSRIPAQASAEVAAAVAAEKAQRQAADAELAGDIGTLSSGKVDKVAGKGLSTNDFTDALKTKLDGIEAGAEVNDVTSVAGKTGTVTLDAGDVSYSDETTYADGTVGAAVSGLKSDLSDIESDAFAPSSEEYPHKTITEMFTDGTYPLGVVYPPANTTQIAIVDIESYNSYYVTVSEAMDIFFDSSLSIGTFQIGKISSVTRTERIATQLVFYGSDAVRYRIGSASDLPVETNKLHVSAGDTLIISIGTSISPDNVTIYYGQKQPVGADHTLMNDNLKLNDSQIQQVIEALPESGDFPDSAKRALLTCFRHVAWIDGDGQDYYDALLEALEMDGTLDSITATFNQKDAAIYSDNSLNSLKPFLTVTANYTDGTTAPVLDYTLSGTLAVGNCTITVSYEGKTATFTVKCIAYSDHVTIDGVSYDISLSGHTPYKFIVNIGNNLYLYYADYPFYLRGAFPQSSSQDDKYVTNIYGNTYRGVQSGTSFDSQGIVGMTTPDAWSTLNDYDEDNLGDMGREGNPRILSQIKWSLNNIYLYDNGCTDTVVYPATT